MDTAQLVAVMAWLRRTSHEVSMYRKQCAGCDRWFTAKKPDEIFCEKCAKEFEACRNTLANGDKDNPQMKLL